MMKKIFLPFLFSLFSIMLIGQDYNIPKDYKFDTKESYSGYEPQVKETITWLLSTSLGKDAIKRSEANSFLMAWVGGTPNVTIGISPQIVNFIDKNPELLIPFIAGWTEYSLNDSYSKDQVQGNKAGVEAVVAFYLKNRGYLKKDGNVEKYAKLIEKGKLEDDIAKRIKK